MTNLALAQHIDVIATDLATRIPADGRTIRLRYEAAGTLSTSTVTVTTAAGVPTVLDEFLSDDVEFALKDLREDAYTPGRGTWFVAAITVTSGGEVFTDFDYDREPDFAPLEPVPMTWLEDALAFPRDDEHRPAWLREYLTQAGA
jgi:hypothetical protein